MGSRLMIVDDDQALRAMVRVAVRLNRLGRIVAEAGTSVDATRLAELKRPDAIVLDLYLADAGGRAVFSAVREASPASRVVVYTAHESDKAWYERRGAAFVPKSVATDDLVNALRLA